MTPFLFLGNFTFNISQYLICFSQTARRLNELPDSLIFLLKKDASITHMYRVSKLRSDFRILFLQYVLNHPLSIKCLFQVHSLFLSCQSQIEAVTEKVSTVQGMIQSRQACLRKLADIQVRPIQLVAPRPENSPRCKSPLFSPKHSMFIYFNHICSW